MKKALMDISTQAMFTEAVCVNCLNDDEQKEIFCNILGVLAMNGEHDCVYELDKLEDGCFYKCMMKRTEKDINKESIIDWIGIAQTEEVEEVLEVIEASYHYDVINSERVAL